MSDYQLRRENELGLRIAELEAQLRVVTARNVDLELAMAAVLEDPTHRKLRAAVRRIDELTQLLDDARTVAIILEGECDSCPAEQYHRLYAYREDRRG